MSFLDRLFHPSKQQPAPPPKSAEPKEPEWEKLTDDTIRQNLDHYGVLLIRVFDFTEQKMTVDGTGRGSSLTVPFADIDEELLRQARDEMVKRNGFILPVVPVQLSEEWHQLAADVVEQTSLQKSGKGIHTVKKIFDFKAERFSSETVDVSPAFTLPFSHEDPQAITRARLELGKLKEAAILPFKTGTTEEVIAPQKATFRKRGKAVAL